MEARRVVKPGGVFAVYDVLQGEGGEVLYPVRGRATRRSAIWQRPIK